MRSTIIALHRSQLTTTAAWTLCVPLIVVCVIIVMRLAFRSVRSEIVDYF